MKYNVGDIINGQVIAIKPYGAFIKINKDTVGLLHISEISHEYIKDVNSVLKVKDEVKVKIVSINRTNKHMIFSMKALERGGRRRTKNRSRFKYHENIMETSKGFSELSAALDNWIREYYGDNKC
ncbi:S1 RNA-binding domain-containing protein [Erysipelotrichaceae bacterium OttesenSCG-928-M19]|nr:S1 RNA-binding domain-containing protein [Erysipelotrichaceae bacterium OttesenSCG-928-M19]